MDVDMHAYTYAYTEETVVEAPPVLSLLALLVRKYKY